MINQETEERVMAFLLCDETAGQFISHLEAEDFQILHWKETFRMIRKCWTDFRKIPPPREFWGYTKQHSEHYKTASVMERKSWEAALRHVYTEVEITLVTRRQIAEWVWEQGLRKIANLRGGSEPCEEQVRFVGSVTRRIAPLLSRKDNHAAMILSDESIEEEIQYRESATSDPFPLGIRLIDNELPHSGLERGDLAVVLGPRGRGKSIILMQLMVTALERRRRCLYITLESTKTVARRRMVANITGTSPKADRTAREVREAATAWKQQHNFDPSLALFHPLPSMQTTLDDVMMTFDAQEAVHGPIDMLLIDYGNLLRPSITYRDKWTALGDLAQEMAGIAVERDIVIWSAFQANRAGDTAEVLDLTHTAGSIDIGNAPSLVVTIEQRPDEKTEAAVNTARLGVPKNRNGRSGFRVACLINPELSRIWQDPSVSETLTMEGPRRSRRQDAEEKVVQIGEHRKKAETGGISIRQRSTGDRLSVD